MLNRLKNKTRLQKLQSQYCKMMKSAYHTALKDKVKSDKIHEEAHLILREITKLKSHNF